MSFQRILEEMVAEVDGSIAALFLDYDGEAVDVAGRNVSKHDLQVIGAYQGIFLDRVRKICTAVSHGEPLRFKIDTEGSSFLNTVLKDGYYLVLVLKKGTREAQAWQHLDNCRSRILVEM